MYVSIYRGLNLLETFVGDDEYLAIAMSVRSTNVYEERGGPPYLAQCFVHTLQRLECTSTKTLNSAPTKNRTSPAVVARSSGLSSHTKLTTTNTS